MTTSRSPRRPAGTQPDIALTDEEFTSTIAILQQFSCPVGQAPHVIGIIQKLAAQRDGGPKVRPTVVPPEPAEADQA